MSGTISLLMQIGWFLTGLIAVAWIARVIAADDALFGDVEVVLATFFAAVAVIAIWSVILVKSAIDASRQLRREMREEGWPGPD